MGILPSNESNFLDSVNKLLEESKTQSIRNKTDLIQLIKQPSYNATLPFIIRLEIELRRYVKACQPTAHDITTKDLQSKALMRLVNNYFADKTVDIIGVGSWANQTSIKSSPLDLKLLVNKTTPSIHQSSNLFNYLRRKQSAAEHITMLKLGNVSMISGSQKGNKNYNLIVTEPSFECEQHGSVARHFIICLKLMCHNVGIKLKGCIIEKLTTIFANRKYHILNSTSHEDGEISSSKNEVCVLAIGFLKFLSYWGWEPNFSNPNCKESEALEAFPSFNIGQYNDFLGLKQLSEFCRKVSQILRVLHSREKSSTSDHLLLEYFLKIRKSS